MANNQRPHMQWLHTKFQPPSFETEAVVREDSNVQTSWEFSFGFQNCWKGCVNLNFLNTLCRIKVNTKTKTGWGHTHCRQVLVSHLVVHNCQRKL